MDIITSIFLSYFVHQFDFNLFQLATCRKINLNLKMTLSATNIIAPLSELHNYLEIIYVLHVKQISILNERKNVCMGNGAFSVKLAVHYKEKILI